MIESPFPDFIHFSWYAWYFYRHFLVISLLFNWYSDFIGYDKYAGYNNLRLPL